jgi:alkylation response protein AidB-like acyl-CoA dehydrogenase
VSTTDDELGLLRASLRGALGTATPDALPAPDPDWRSSWSDLAALGITAFCVPEEAGGFGLRADAAALAAGELGAALHGSPYAGTIAAARALTAAGGSDTLVAAIVAGEAVVAWGRLDHTGARAHLVDGAPDADALVLLDPAGTELLVLEDPSSWTVGAEHPFDTSRRCGDVTITGSAGRRVPADPVAASLFGLLLAADALGCVQRSLGRTTTYAGERVAFGKVIGGFQAVQHRLADHVVRFRGVELAVAEAARRLADGDDDAPRFVALAEVGVSSSASHVLHDLLQLTGAIGFTWEYGLHHHQRRVHQDSRLAGNPRRAASTLAALEGWR